MPEKEGKSYVLMSAAYNEATYIEKTIQAVLAQTVRPQRWVIVSDGSTDATDQIVASYAEKNEFICLVRVNRTAGHSFGAKIRALREAEKLLLGLNYAFIGNLDADLAVEATYYEALLKQFEAHPQLGILSGFVYEDHGDGFRSRWFNDVRNAPHAAQLVRRECYEAIGGYALLKYGGEDWHAQISARMRGWEVESLPRVKIFHFRHTGGKSMPLRNSYRLGKMDYAFGSDPVFAIGKSLRRLKEPPYILNSLARISGFLSGYLVREPRELAPDAIAYLRSEQKSRLKSPFSRTRSSIGGAPGFNARHGG